MTRSHRTLVFAAVSVLGFAGWESQAANEPGEAGEPPVAQPAGDHGPKLVLLNDGRIISGVISDSEDDGKITITQPAGVMRFPERKVVRAFDSIQELHQYKCDQVPEGDMDEQLKLAQWCMSKDLIAEAEGHLKNILAIDPKHGQAKAMVASIKMTETRVAMNHQRDAAVQQTGAEVVEAAPAGRPATLDSAVVQGARRGLGVGDLPVVFDLPPGAALKRASEFQKYVHPVLQTYCAKCHNDRYEGDFHLIGFKTRAERTPDTLRANLDAVLRIVDRANPGRSELLASSLRPHGQGSNTRPIFAGSNDQAYRILAAWVNNLRVQPPATAALPSASAESGRRTEDFAVGRTRISQGTVEVEPVYGGPAVGGPVQNVIEKSLPPMRYEPGRGFNADADADPSQYPIPFAVSGVRPKLPPGDGQPSPSIPRPKAAPETVNRSAPSPATASADAKGLPVLPAADQAAAAVEAGEDDEPASEAVKPAKKLKIDPALLQRALQLRNGPR